MTLLRHPIYGIYTYLFTFYMSPAHSWWRSEVPEIRYLFIIGLLTFLSFYVRKSSQNKYESEKRVSWISFGLSKILVAFAVWMWIQSLWALDVERHLDGAVTFTKHVLVSYLIYYLFDTPEKIRNFLYIHLLGCTWFGYLALGAGGGRLESIGGPVGGANELSAHIMTALIIGGIMWISLRGWKRLYVLLCIPLAANTLVLTVSRGAFLGFFSAGIISGFFLPKIYKKKFVALSVLCVILLSLLAHDQLIDRFVETYQALTSDEVEIDGSAKSRSGVFWAGIEMGKDHPFGAGYRGTAVLSPFYMDDSLLAGTGQRSAHNNFAMIFAEQGYPGVVFFILLNFLVIKQLFRIKTMQILVEDRSLMVALGSALIGMYVSGNFSANFYTETQYWLLALLLSFFSQLQNSGKSMECNRPGSSQKNL